MLRAEVAGSLRSQGFYPSSLLLAELEKRTGIVRLRLVRKQIEERVSILLSPGSAKEFLFVVIAQRVWIKVFQNELHNCGGDGRVVELPPVRLTRAGNDYALGYPGRDQDRRHANA